MRNYQQLLINYYWVDLINEVEYLNDKLHGEWIEYYKSGNIKAVTMYKFDRKEGMKTTFYDNGIKQSETLYKDDIAASTTIRWDNNGKILE